MISCLKGLAKRSSLQLTAALHNKRYGVLIVGGKVEHRHIPPAPLLSGKKYGYSVFKNIKKQVFLPGTSSDILTQHEKDAKANLKIDLLGKKIVLVKDGQKD